MLKIFFFLLSVIIMSALSANDSFVLRSLIEAQNLSQQTKQPILLIFGNDNCRFCNNLKQDIINNELSPNINKYIICYLDTTENEEMKIKYKVSTIPDSIVIFDQTEKARIKGYSKDTYLKWLSNVRY